MGNKGSKKMKATLIKEKEGVYSLLDGNRFISTTECKEDTPNKLSLKNCEAIANGYDLDELVKNIKTEDGFEHKQSFISGFQKALEIKSDKKFSEEDMRKGFEAGYETLASDKTYNEHYDKLIQSLQQTEWAVIVETVGLSYLRDKDDCLILKRI